MVNLSNLEKETIISFNEAEPFAEIETYNSRLKRRFSELKAARPEEVTRLEAHNGDSVVYRFPKTWAKVNPSRIFSHAQKAEMVRRAKALCERRGVQTDR